MKIPMKKNEWEPKLFNAFKSIHSTLECRRASWFHYITQIYPDFSRNFPDFSYFWVIVRFTICSCKVAVWPFLYVLYTYNEIRWVLSCFYKTVMGRISEINKKRRERQLIVSHDVFYKKNERKSLWLASHKTYSKFSKEAYIEKKKRTRYVLTNGIE